MNSNNYKILITGGGSGIGAALAEGLSSDGHSIVICGRRSETLEEVVSSNNNVSSFVCDVSNESNVISFVDYVKERYDFVDVVINCAGLQGEIGRFDKTDSKRWLKTFEINMFGTYLVTKHFLNLLLKSKVKKILNFAGGGALGPFPNYSAYAVSKAAVVRFSENIAVELEDLGVQVNCVAPGFVNTEIHNATINAGIEIAGDDYYKFTLEKMKEGSVPIDVVVNCVKFLISPESNGLKGKIISASFDGWNSPKFRNLIEKITDSDLYALRRINLVNLGEDDELRKDLCGDKNE